MSHFDLEKAIVDVLYELRVERVFGVQPKPSRSHERDVKEGLCEGFYEIT